MPTGKEILSLAKTRIGCRYDLGVVVPKSNADYKGAFDCAEFTSWLLYQVAKVLYGCAKGVDNPLVADAYTGFWRRDAEQLGEIVTVEKAAATAGAFLLRFPAASAIGHIAVSDGNGGTVEAHSTAKGLIQGTVHGRRWDIGVEPFMVDYSVVKPPIVITPPSTVIYRLIKPMMHSEVIKNIQTALNKNGANKITVDGWYGSNTTEAVVAFQKRKGLLADGEVGRATAEALCVSI